MNENINWKKHVICSAHWSAEKRENKNHWDYLEPDWDVGTRDRDAVKKAGTRLDKNFIFNKITIF
jgi:hypothetical protein